jgi:hypothetical protein
MDPGCPIIACMIGDTKVERALLDLGTNVNLLPYSVYVQLGLGELKPTSVTLQLADRFVKVPRGIIEDVLIKVDKFYSCGFHRLRHRTRCKCGDSDFSNIRAYFFSYG